MSPNPRITTSVALCTCNGERWIATQLRSILDQEHPVDEIVLSDDASTDRTLAIVRETLGCANVQFRILEAPSRQGFVANFEKAVRHCSNDVVLFCDQDDLWEPCKVGTILELLETSDWLASDAALIDSDGRELGSRLWQRLGFSPRSIPETAQIRSRLLRRPLFTGATMACRRNALETCLPFHPNFPHDQWISLVLSLSGIFPALCTRPLIRYRLHDSQQFGLRAASWHAMAGKGLGSSTEGYLDEAMRCQALLEHLRALNAPAEGLALVSGKIRHMQARAELGPLSFPARLALVLRELLSGRYCHSWTRLAPLKDVLKPRKARQ